MKKKSTNIQYYAFLALLLLIGLPTSIKAETPSSPTPEASPSLDDSNLKATAAEESPATTAPAVDPANEPETNPSLRPDLVITNVGGEYNLKVSYSHPMDFAGQNFIEYVRMETLDGEFLGLTTYNDKSTKATADFMVNPELTKIENIRFVAKSSKAGLIKSVHKLEVTKVEVKTEPAETTANPAAEKMESSPSKKKFLGIF